MSDEAQARTFSGFGRTVDLFLVALAASAVLYSGFVAFVEMRHGFSVDDPLIFGIVAVLLVVTEAKSTSIVTHAAGGIVTPSWAFTFTLVLLGSPTAAILISAFATVLADRLSGRPWVKVLFNVSQISLSLSLGALVLIAFGIHGPLFDDASLSTKRCLAMILSGVIIFTSNGVIICRLLAWLDGSRFWETMRGSFLLSMTSDAAMLAIAPIFLLTAKNNLLMLPLMGTATFFVYQTAQNALLRTYEANHDPLTQLRNRRAFTAEVETFLVVGAVDTTEASLFLLDLDRFKEINDRLGHNTGDQVLQAFANRLVEVLPEDTFVARLGGDEFAVFVTDRSPHAAEELARTLHGDLAKPLIVDGFPITAGTSVGVAHSPVHGRTAGELTHAADVAMYRAKRRRSRVEIYQPLGPNREKGRVTLLAEVADALDRDEFFLEYQPQIDMRTGRMVSVEALLRWNHPVHGRITPDEFVSLAEHTDLIGPITRFVVERAADEIGPLGHEVGLAINVSARNLEDRHFVSSLLDELDRAGFPPDRLEIEITESALSSDVERSVVALDELSSAGVRISIDDFGTGYSSFGTLRDSVIDRIKIDRSFITNCTATTADLQILRSLIDLAHGLGLEVVAEGIETVGVWNAVSRLGCDAGQGYLMSGPVAAELLPALATGRLAPDVEPSHDTRYEVDHRNTSRTFA